MSWIQRYLYGVDLDEEQSRANDLDAAQAADLERSRSKYTDANFKAAQLHITADDAPHVQADVDQAFDEGLQEGSENISGVIRKPFEIGGVAIASVLKGIPWWVWLSSAVLLAWKLGLLDGIFKGVARRAKA